MRTPTFEDFRTAVAGARVAVLGVGISNQPLIRLLDRLGARVTAFDRMAEDHPRLQQIKQGFQDLNHQLAWRCGPDYLQDLTGFDYIFRTPIIRPDLPQLLRARADGAIVTSEMRVFFALCPAPITAVTGSDGKTTTTTLIELMLREAGYKTWLGGNIGTPLLDQVERIGPADQVVLELSSFQLMDLDQSPDVAVITNISPNHLDVHRDFAEYIEAKRNILAHQTLFDRVVLNQRNLVTQQFAATAKGRVDWFNASVNGAACAFVEGSRVLRRTARQARAETVMELADIRLPGQHNLENYLAAIAAVGERVPAAAIRRVAQSFAGVPHRLEWVRKLDGVDWYNSSIDSSPTRSKATLSALRDLGRPVVILCGGKDKNSDYSGLGRMLASVARDIVYCGANAELIAESFAREADSASKERIGQHHCADYPQAVARCRQLAQPGDVVVLSPAGTSFDRFQNFEERGVCFRELVLALAEQSHP